jgi:DNA-binding transcriptional ArsR family regulator
MNDAPLDGGHGVRHAWAVAALLVSIMAGCDQPTHSFDSGQDGTTRIVSMHAGACLHLCEPRIPPNARLAQFRRLEAHELLINETRARIHRQLAIGPQTLTALARSLGLTNSTVLWHLGKLITAGLVHVDRDQRAPLYHAPQLGTSLPEAIRVVHSIPARELIEHLVAHPRQHLGQAAAAMGAPRARSWRVVPDLQRMRLVKVTTQGRKHLLVATPLAEQALRALPGRRWAAIKKRRTRRILQPSPGAR